MTNKRRVTWDDIKISPRPGLFAAWSRMCQEPLVDWGAIKDAQIEKTDAEWRERNRLNFENWKEVVRQTPEQEICKESVMNLLSAMQSQFEQAKEESPHQP